MSRIPWEHAGDAHNDEGWIMHLKRLTLNNFRCYENLELDLHPRLTVIVGENGGGKTAILDAIAVGLSPVLRYLSSANQRLSGTGIKDTDFRIEPWGNGRWGSSDYSQVIVETTKKLKWDTWKASSKGKAPSTKVGEAELAQTLARVTESFKSREPELLPVFAYYGAQRGHIDIPQRLRAGKQNYSHPTSALIDALDARSDFREMLQWFDLEESAELRANKGARPDEYQESQALTAVRTAIDQVLGKVYSNPRFNRDHRFVVDAEQGPTPLQVNQLSQGYQSMLALAMDFARRLAIGNGQLVHSLHPYAGEVDATAIEILDEMKHLNPLWFREDDAAMDLPSFAAPSLLAPSIMLIDELDLHLHASWQQRVLDDLLRAFPMTQFIVTTHSPQVLTTTPSESIRILKDNKVYAAPPGTEGSEPERMLRQVLGLEEVRPPASLATQELKEYLSLVDRDQWASSRAQDLRKKLEQRYQGQEPALLDADLQIENRKWELGG